MLPRLMVWLNAPCKNSVFEHVCCLLLRTYQTNSGKNQCPMITGWQIAFLPHDFWDTPILEWNSSTVTYFDKIPKFGQAWYSFLYRSETAPNKNLLARSVHSHFFGMQSDERLCRVYVPTTRTILILRLADFNPCKDVSLPSVSTFLDGLSRQSEMDLLHKVEYGTAQEGLLKAYFSEAVITAMSVNKKTRSDPLLLKSFSKAIRYINWRETIDLEFRALRKLNTWYFSL